MISSRKQRHTLIVQSPNWHDSVFSGPTGAEWQPPDYLSPGPRGPQGAILLSQGTIKVVAQVQLLPYNKEMTIP